MKHWHKCRRWTDLKFPCPFMSMAGHDKEPREPSHRKIYEEPQGEPNWLVEEEPQGIGEPVQVPVERPQDVQRMLEPVQKELPTEEPADDEPFAPPIRISPPVRAPKRAVPKPQPVPVREPARRPVVARSGVAQAARSAMRATSVKAVQKLYQSFDASQEGQLAAVGKPGKANVQVPPQRLAAMSETAVAREMRSRMPTGRSGIHSQPTRGAVSHAVQKMRTQMERPSQRGYSLTRKAAGVTGGLRGGGGGGFFFNAADRMRRLIGSIN